MKNFSYLIGCKKTNMAAVIDCGFDAEKIASMAKKEGMKIEKILLTHVHYDHSGAAEKLSKLTGANIFMNPKSAWKAEKKEGSWIIPSMTTPLLAGESFSVGNITGKIIAAPGHQNDHLLFEIAGYLFTGDVLFIEGSGRTDLLDSNSKKAEKTLAMIAGFSDELIICPGHDYGSVPMRSLGEERNKNKSLSSY